MYSDSSIKMQWTHGYNWQTISKLWKCTCFVLLAVIADTHQTTKGKAALTYEGGVEAAAPSSSNEWGGDDEEGRHPPREPQPHRLCMPRLHRPGGRQLTMEKVTRVYCASFTEISIRQNMKNNFYPQDVRSQIFFFWPGSTYLSKVWWLEINARVQTTLLRFETCK